MSKGLCGPGVEPMIHVRDLAFKKKTEHAEINYEQGGGKR